MSDSGSNGSGSSLAGSSDSEDEQQHVQEAVTGANADPEVLQYFWQLASLQQEERQAAAEALVTALVDSQQQYDASHRLKDATPAGSLDQEGAGNRQQRMEQSLACCSPLMAYGLKRLARGLASGRQGARQGFAAALAATLAQSAAAATAAAGAAAGQQQQQLGQPFITAAGVLALLDACLEVTGSMKGTDQRDALLGRVFGLAALTRSGLITALPAAAADGSSSSGSSPATVLAATAAVAEQLSGLLLRKSFLRESAAAGLVELLQGLEAEQLAPVLASAPKTTSLLQAPAAQATPESLFLALRLWHALPVQLLQKCQLLPQLPAGQSPPPRVFWEQPASVKRSRVAAVAAAVFTDGQVRAMGPALLLSTASSPRLHPVWGCLLALLVPGFVPVKGPEQPEQQQQRRREARSPPDLQQLQNFWQHFVEPSCLSSSHERKALALQLLQLLLPVMEPDAVPVLLGRQLLGCVSTALKDKDSYLHASAKRCLDRLTTAAEHNHVVLNDPAATARLRLALAAALQSANLANLSSRSAKAAKLGPLQGLDAEGVEDYVSQTLQALVQAAQGGQHKAAAGATNGAAGGSDDDDDEEQGDAADEAKALQQLEQLVAGLKLPAAGADTLRKGLSFLAALAWLQLPPAFSAAATAAAAGAGSGKQQAGKKAKKQQQKQQQQGEAGGVLSQAAVQEGLALAASILPGGPSSTLRQTAAARLVALLHHLQHRACAQAAAAAHQKQQPKQQPKQQKEGQQAAAPAAAAAAAQHAASLQAAEGLAVELLDLFVAAQKLPGVTATADEDIAEMAEQLGQLAAAVEQHTPSAPAAAAGGTSSQQQQQAVYAARKRVVLHLVRQLQLQLLSGGLSAEAAGSVVDDLEVSVLRGLGLNGQLLEQLRAVDAQAKLQMAGAAAAAGGSSDDDDGDDPAAGGSDDDSSLDGAGASSEGGEDSDSDSDDDAWQDVLLDLLLSLLSNSEGGGSSSSGGRDGVHVPSVPLREACEAVFKAFAEEMTAQGIADLLRVLSKRASEVLKPTDEDDEEVEQSEGGDDSSRDNDESSELDEEQQQQLQDLHNKTAAVATSGSTSSSIGSDSDSEPTPSQPSTAANGTPAEADAAATGSDGSSDDDDDDLDDAAMLRLDAQLGAAVRASISRGGGGAKERAAALLALQLRVASLLEDWLKKCQRSPIVLSVVLPLVKALVSARGPGGNPVLANRLAGLISKHLARTRPVLPMTPADTAAPAADTTPAAPAVAAVAALEADARKVLYYASRDKDPRVAAAGGQSLLVLLAAGSEAGGAAAAVAQAAAADALQDFLLHKKSRLQQSWVQQLLSRCFDAVVGGEGGALQALLTACSKGRNEAIRSKAVQLLPALVAGRQQQPQQAALLLAALKQQQVAALLPAALAGGVCGPFRSKEQHAGAVKALVVLLGGLQKLGGGKRLAELLGSEAVRELGKSVVVVKAAGVPPKVEVQLDRLAEAAGLQQLVAAGKPDPARLALLKKARAALEGSSSGGGGGKKGAAAAGAAAGAEADAGGGAAGGVANGLAAQGPKAAQGSKGADQPGKPKQKQQQGEKQPKGQQQQGQKQPKDKQQKQKQKRKAEAAAEPEQQQQQPQQEAAQQQQQQQRHKKKQKQQHVEEDVAAVAAAAAQAAAAATGKGGSKRKHAGGEACGQDRPQGKKQQKQHKQQGKH